MTLFLFVVSLRFSLLCSCLFGVAEGSTEWRFFVSCLFCCWSSFFLAAIESLRVDGGGGGGLAASAA